MGNLNSNSRAVAVWSGSCISSGVALLGGCVHEAADLDAIRQQVRVSETLLGYVTGRVVGAGRGVWLVTDQAVVMRSGSSRAARRIALDEVEFFETERGRFGHTVRMRAEGRAWSLYGVDRELAGTLQQALLDRNQAVVDLKAAAAGLQERLVAFEIGRAHV